MLKLRWWLRTVLLIAIGLSCFPVAWADLSDIWYPDRDFFHGNIDNIRTYRCSDKSFGSNL